MDGACLPATTSTTTIQSTSTIIDPYGVYGVEAPAGAFYGGDGLKPLTVFVFAGIILILIIVYATVKQRKNRGV